MSETVMVGIPLVELIKVREELKMALTPMVPYKRDPLEFANAAHEVKDRHIEKALRMLPLGIVAAEQQPPAQEGGELCDHGFATSCPEGCC